MKIFVFSLIAFCSYSLFAQNVVRGKVVEHSGNDHTPLVGANIFWLNSSVGTASADDGSFSLPLSSETNKLVITYIRYESDTLTVLNTDKILTINLSPVATQTSDVTVTGEKPSIIVDYFGVDNSSILTKKELFKAACCNLSESFETNAAVDVSFTDAVTGSKQIEMLGLSGIYTRTTMENLPFIRGLISSVGLNFIPGTWINSINLSKGLGPVVNGYESITGQIDVDFVKPHAENEESPFFLNLYGDNEQRFEGNLNYRIELAENLAAINLIHWSNRRHEADLNSDRFLDMPTFNTFNIMQRWQYHAENGWESQFGFQYANDEKSGGTLYTGAAPDVFPPLNNSFRYNNKNKFFNFFSKTGYVFPEEPHKSFGFQINYNNYETNSLFGLREYNGLQKSFYFNFIFQSFFVEEIHKFKLGSGFSLDDFKENFTSLDFRRVERVPGAFFEYTYSPAHEFSMIAGIRGDYHSFYGAMLTPRLHFRYSPVEEWVFRAAAGRGYRTANILAENSSSFISSRALDILSVNNFGFGLEQEIAWNFGINATHYFLFDYRDASISVDFYHTLFENTVIPDLDFSPGIVRFYSVDNGAYSNSFQTELNFKPLDFVDLRLAYRFLDSKQFVNGQWLPRPFTSKNRALLNIAIRAYRSDDLESELLFDITTQWFGQKRIPSTSQNPVEFRRDDYSPSFVILNAQTTYSLSPLLSVYIGGENLLDFKQSNPIINPGNPQDRYFDASLIWGPVSGRMIYAGLRSSF